ncbi:protein jagged-2-like isoform X2 [Mercenaria mercenaria]|uniref:protein jagged-2-like isoform X2 n=1 Tax=Mercenaria mercenaria TaxID=6596 RepID=UPI00234EE781|nr:protein jagged-2-like isoform X2 [Mercenaria mercenaria]
MIKVRMLWLLIVLFYSSTTSALQCLSCQNVPDKRDCHNLLTCGAHQECYTNRVIDGSRRNLYNLGCVDQYACSQLSQSGLGRREMRSAYSDLTFSNSDHKRSVITTCFQCCNSSDGCNLNTCGIALSPCAANPCVHGACSDVSNTDFRCTCHSGYIGRFCDFNAYGSVALAMSSTKPTSAAPTTQTTTAFHIDSCIYNPCMRGQCSPYQNTYRCTCEAGFWGRNCEKDSAILTVTTTHASPTTKNAVCAYKGQLHYQGQTWQDGCSQMCTCTDAENGLYSCRAVCLNWTSLPSICHLEDPVPGLCCKQPRCPSGVIISIPKAYRHQYPGYTYV